MEGRNYCSKKEPRMKRITQSKINAFFEPKSSIPPHSNFKFAEEESVRVERAKSAVSVGKRMKRSCEQLYLKLGQSDFLLHSCSTCGLNYSIGDSEDERLHRTFHRNYTLGVPFKGWCTERVIDKDSVRGEQIIMVLDGDSPAQMKKVQEVISMMETELGGEWIFHKLCKVYMLISSQRVAGCLVVEPIKIAHKIIPSPSDERSRTTSIISKLKRSQPRTLQFGNINFQREVVCKTSSSLSSRETLNENLGGAIICGIEPLPASVGIRAIWVTPLNRRKQIATRLLDAARKCCYTDTILERCQLAFSQPTSSGNALAVHYTGTHSFLVYKT